MNDGISEKGGGNRRVDHSICTNCSDYLSVFQRQCSISIPYLIAVFNQTLVFSDPELAFPRATSTDLFDVTC